MDRFSFVKAAFEVWCHHHGYQGGLLYHGSTEYGKAISSSDVDVIFDSRYELRSLLSKARRFAHGSFQVVESETWFNRRNSTCRVQFRYVGREKDAFGIVVDACARDKGIAGRKISYMQGAFNDYLSHTLGLNIKRWWSECKGQLHDVHAGAKPNSYKILILVKRFMEDRNMPYQKKMLRQ